MKTLSLNVTLTSREGAILRRLRKTGRYASDGEVIHAALRRLDESEWDPNAYPAGSLRHLYTAARAREEKSLNKVSSLRVDHDD